ncbi:MAG: nucleotidyltransferase family protein [bacterium]
MKGIILAAGLGKRLGQLTKKIPKPLLPVGGIPIIQLNIEKLKRAGIDEIGINIYYKPDLMRSFLNKFTGIKVVEEEYLSGTGGALLNFRDFVSDDFLLHNCDVLSDIDLKMLIRAHKKRRVLGTIPLVKNYKTDRVKCLDGRIFKFYKKRCSGCFTYTGIAVLSKRIFEYFPKDKAVFSLTEVYNNAIESGEVLSGIIVNGKWYDIGRIDVYRFITSLKNDY